MAGTLWVVGTPIGNLQDITDRGRQVLAGADLIAAEDTRRTGRLLQHLGIERTRLVSLFEANETNRIPQVLDALRGGQDVALVTDAGMPAVSDPGYRLVAACVEQGLPVDVAPGPSAVTAALVVSGLPTDRFVFEGFLPRSGRGRAERLEALKAERRTVVLFESPRRVAATLADLDPGRRVAVVRELTKLHQEVLRGTVAEVRDRLPPGGLKGEVVIVLEGTRTSGVGTSLAEAVALARELIRSGARKREAARSAGQRTGHPASEIYGALVTDRRPGSSPVDQSGDGAGH